MIQKWLNITQQWLNNAYPKWHLKWPLPEASHHNEDLLQNAKKRLESTFQTPRGTGFFLEEVWWFWLATDRGNHGRRVRVAMELWWKNWRVWQCMIWRDMTYRFCTSLFSCSLKFMEFTWIYMSFAIYQAVRLLHVAKSKFRRAADYIKHIRTQMKKLQFLFSTLSVPFQPFFKCFLVKSHGFTAGFFPLPSPAGCVRDGACAGRGSHLVVATVKWEQPKT